MSKGRAKAPSQRQLRVGEELRHILAQVLKRGKLHDPAVQDTPITVTEVRASPDLKNVTAFVVPLGGDAASAGKRLLREVDGPGEASGATNALSSALKCRKRAISAADGGVTPLLPLAARVVRGVGPACAGRVCWVVVLRGPG